MKILLFRTDPSIMDIKRYNSQEIGMARAYASLGHQCDIVYYNGAGDSRIEFIGAEGGKQIKIFWMKGFRILNNGFFPGITHLVEQYDVIQVSEYYFWGSWYIYKKFGKRKKVYVYQGVYDADNSRRYQIRCTVMDPLLLSESVKRETKIFTKSKLAEASMRRRGFLQVKTVGVGLDSLQLAESGEASDWTHTLVREKQGKAYLLYVGLLEDRRNILFLLDILKAVVEKRPEVCLVLIGKGQSAYVKACRDRICELGLQDHVIYKESLPQYELHHVYRHADIFLLPTKYEIFGMVLMEAMRFGLPVVTSYNGGSSTIIRHGENGMIINTFHAADWAACVLDLLNNDGKAKKLGAQGEETSRRDFSWRRIVQDILLEI